MYSNGVRPLREQIESYNGLCGGLEMAILRINFHHMPVEEVEASMRLFAEEVMPHFTAAKVA